MAIVAGNSAHTLGEFWGTLHCYDYAYFIVGQATVLQGPLTHPLSQELPLRFLVSKWTDFTKKTFSMPYNTIQQNSVVFGLRPANCLQLIMCPSVSWWLLLWWYFESISDVTSGRNVDSLKSCNFICKIVPRSHTLKLKKLQSTSCLAYYFFSFRACILFLYHSYKLAGCLYCRFHADTSKLLSCHLRLVCSTFLVASYSVVNLHMKCILA